jgi:anti-sigma factor RsiW
MTQHLTPAQLHDLLSRTADAPATTEQLHLADCPECQEDCSNLDRSIANFRLAATSFALLHTPPRPVIGTSVRRSFFALPRIVWATGLGSVLALTGATLSTLYRQPSRVVAPVTAAATQQPVSDEALLQDIDSDLSASVPPSLQPLDTTPTASEQTTTSTSN